MSLAIAGIYPGVSFVPDRAVSDEAVDLRDYLADTGESRAVTGRHRDAMERITAALIQGFEEGFYPLSGATEHAFAVMCALPDAIQLPDVVVESDGEIGLDWDSGQRSVLSVIVGEGSMLRYAALIGPEPLHGRVPFAGVLPATLSFILNRIHPD
jgi:hypothetical protein